jgi:AraC-like DNA-binding protein
VRLLGSRSAEERGAVDHGFDAADRGCERIRFQQIALDELDMSFAQVRGAHRIAHEGAHLIAALREAFGEPASDLSGRSRDEDFHLRNLALGAGGGLEKADKRARKLAALRARTQNRVMQASAAHHDRIAPSASTASVVAALFVFECDHDGPRISIPRPEVQLVVRFGPSAQSGLDIHAFGARQRVHRKLIRGGQRTVTARLRLGAPEAVLGVPASGLAGRIVALEDLWGKAATGRLCARLAEARGTVEAAAILERAIAERHAAAGGRHAPAQLALAAADKLTSANVNSVAVDLGVSERHLRRVFRETLGVSPKAFAQLARFHRALRAAREDSRASWASIAAATGYYDQAHLIAEFRAIAGVTPRVLLGELGAAASSAKRGLARPSNRDAEGFAAKGFTSCPSTPRLHECVTEPDR